MRLDSRAFVDWLIFPGWRWPRTRTLALDRLPAEGEALWRGEAGEGIPHSLDLHLGGELVLARHHRLPSKGRAQAVRALALQLKLLSPSGRDEFLAGARRVASSGGVDTHLQVVARRGDVDALLALARAQGIAVRRVLADVEGAAVGLLDGRAAADRDGRAWWGLALVAGLLLLGWADLRVWGQARAWAAAADGAREDLTSLQAQAADLARAREEAGTLDAAVAADAALFLRDADPVSRLADLTAALPASAWLTTLIIEPGRVALEGATSAEAGDLVGALDALPWVSRVELARPFLPDPSTGSTSFEFALTASGVGP